MQMFQGKVERADKKAKDLPEWDSGVMNKEAQSVVAE